MVTEQPGSMSVGSRELHVECPTPSTSGASEAVSCKLALSTADDILGFPLSCGLGKPTISLSLSPEKNVLFPVFANKQENSLASTHFQTYVPVFSHSLKVFFFFMRIGGIFRLAGGSILVAVGKLGKNTRRRSEARIRTCKLNHPLRGIS